MKTSHDDRVAEQIDPAEPPVAASDINVGLASVQGLACANTSTAASGFAGCNLNGLGGSTLTADAAVIYNTQAHDVAGFASVFYLLAGD